jgi:hypothetical protein
MIFRGGQQEREGTLKMFDVTLKEPLTDKSGFHLRY